MPEAVADRLLPNRRLRCVLLGIQAVMGRNGLNAALKLAGLQRHINRLPPANGAREVRASEYAALVQAIEIQFGSGARGQLNRIGQAAFRELVKMDVWAWRWVRWINRFSAPDKRPRRALEQLARHLAEPKGRVWVYTDGARLLLADETGDATRQRNRATETCWLTLGQIQEGLEWATGCQYAVLEVACQAKGDAECVFEVGERLG